MADHNDNTINNSESDVPASFNLSEADELRVRGWLTAKAEALRKRLPEAIGNLPLDLNLMLYSYAADPYSYLKSDSKELTAAVSALNNWKKEAMWYLNLNMQLNLGVLARYLQGIVNLIPSAAERSEMARRIREDDFTISSDAPLDFSERIQMIEALDNNHRAALLDLLRWSRFNDPASEQKPSIKTSVPPSVKTESAVSSGSFTDIKNILLSRPSTVSAPVKLAVNEEDIRAFLASGTPVTTSDFAAKFGPKMTTPADKAAFYDMVTRLTMVRKAGGKRVVVLKQFARAAGENENEVA